MKDYGYVKEYGEGVDRMCRELEALGLPDPAFNNDTFILKTTVKSFAYKKLPIDEAKVAGSAKKLPVRGTETADSPDAVQAVNDIKKNIPVKLPIEAFITAYQDRGYNEPTIVSLMKIYQEIEANQVFGSSYLVKLLECSDRTARNLMSKLREMKAITAVAGKGKGMYRFTLESDLESPHSDEYEPS